MNPYLHVFFSYLVFFVGYALHAALQVDAQVRSSANSATTRVSVLKSNVFVILMRLFISALVLALLRGYPQYLAPLLSFAGVTTTSFAVSTSSEIFAAAWGVVGDSLLTFIPFLKNYVPPLNGGSKQ